MANELKTYVLTVATLFPTTHARTGQPTGFEAAIASGRKKHTIRQKFANWKKKIDLVNEGNAIISLRQWTAKPYDSPQVERRQYSAGQIGIQKLVITGPGEYTIDDKKSYLITKTLANNDGLSVDDFKEWFKKAKYGEELALIHFTDKRYI